MTDNTLSYPVVNHYQGRTPSANLNLNGIKPLLGVSLAIVGVYATIKLVDKLYNASVEINADKQKVEQ